MSRAAQRVYLRWIVALLLLCPALTSAVPESAVLKDTTTVFFPGRMQYFADPSGTLGLADAQERFRRGHATTSQSPQVSGGFILDGALWLHLRLHRAPEALVNWWLELGENPVEDIRVYVTGPGGAFEMRSGLNVPIEQRDIQWLRHAVLLTLAHPGSYDVYVRYASSSTLRMTPALYAQSAFRHERSLQYLLLGGFFAIMGLACLLGAYRAIRFRSMVDAWYMLYVGALETTNLGIFGVLQHFAMLADPRALQITRSLGLVVAVISIFGFMLTLIDWPAAIRQIFRRGIVAFSGLYTVGWLIAVRGNYDVYYVVTGSTLVLVVLLTAAAWSAWRGFPNARWFLAAFSPFLLTALARGAEAQGYLNAGGALYYLWIFTSILHAVLLMVAILTREARMHNARRLLEWEVSRLQDDVANQRLFTRTLAHEVRTPLAIIDANTQVLLRRTQQDSPNYSLLKSMRDCVMRVSNVLERFIGQDRLTAAGKLDSRTVDLDEMIRDIVNQVQRTTQQHLIKHRSEGDPISLECDPALMDVVITNLLENAIRYSPEGGAIEVRTSVTRDGKVTIAVSDEGVGIPEDAREKIFQRYYRTGQVRNSVGAGLGLYLVRSIVGLHGGEIRCDSTLGEGSTFTVTLLPCGMPVHPAG